MSSVNWEPNQQGVDYLLNQGRLERVEPNRATVDKGDDDRR